MAVAQGATGGTTVAATSWLAAQAGIRVFATGGIGGVHRNAGQTFDVKGEWNAAIRRTRQPSRLFTYKFFSAPVTGN